MLVGSEKRLLHDFIRRFLGTYQPPDIAAQRRAAFEKQYFKRFLPASDIAASPKHFAGGYFAAQYEHNSHLPLRGFFRFERHSAVGSIPCDDSVFGRRP